jgi:hypothetical protein
MQVIAVFEPFLRTAEDIIDEALREERGEDRPS